MTTAVYAATPASFHTIKPVTFIAANGTSAKVVVQPYAAAAAGAQSPLYYGGCTVLDLTASSTDSANKDVLVYRGRVVTTQDSTATGTMSTSGTNAINRASGSFITDGVVPGDNVMLFAPATSLPNTTVALTSPSSVDGILGTVTSVTDLAITVNGTPFANMTLATGTRLFVVRQLFRATVALNSGNTAALPNVALLGNAMDSTALKTELKLGATEGLIVGMQSAVSALPAFVSIDGQVARY